VLPDEVRVLMSSRSDDVMVAVRFNLRIVRKTGGRRGATLE